MLKEPLFKVKGLQTYFFTEEGIVKAVDGVDFEVYKGETLGIVGESACGKSTIALSILRLIPNPPGRIIGGEIYLDGKNLLEMSDSQMRKIRGSNISMIFQEPMTSLNPAFTIGDQIAEAIELHQGKKKKEALEMAAEMLRKVDIPLPKQRIYEYPHQLSGGMRQRAMIAMALPCNPKLLIADEPTTALDVTIQAQILDLMNELRDELETAVILITHDFGIIAEVADRVVVMYAGKIVEYADVKTIINHPQHPYTWGLINCIPKLTEKKKRLQTIEGLVPDPKNLPRGCSFYPRCKFSDNKCKEIEPEIREIEKNHQVRCWHYKKINENRNKIVK